MSARDNLSSTDDLIQYPNHDFRTAEKVNKKVWSYPEDPYESERDAIAILRRNGIYAVHGRWSEWRFTDIVAFGCVRIESKFSSNKPYGQNAVFQWPIAPRHHDNGLRGEVVMLAADFGDYVETALFPSTHAIFYNDDGTLKKGLQYRPDRIEPSWQENRYGQSLTPDIWHDHLNNFGLVWDVLYKNVKKLDE